MEGCLMELSESAIREIADVVRKAVRGFSVPCESPVVTDIHLQPVRESGELVVSDDDRELRRAVIPELAGIPEDSFHNTMENVLRSVLQMIDRDETLDLPGIWKPFSYVMTDDDGETVAELMLFDDDTQLVSQTLMAGLDEDLEKFLKDLMLD